MPKLLIAIETICNKDPNNGCALCCRETLIKLVPIGIQDMVYFTAMIELYSDGLGDCDEENPPSVHNLFMDNDAKYAIENNLIDENLAAMLMADVQLLESENDQIIGSAANSSPARGGKNIGRFGS